MKNNDCYFRIIESSFIINESKSIDDLQTINRVLLPTIIGVVATPTLRCRTIILNANSEAPTIGAHQKRRSGLVLTCCLKFQKIEGNLDKKIQEKKKKNKKQSI